MFFLISPVLLIQVSFINSRIALSKIKAVVLKNEPVLYIANYGQFYTLLTMGSSIRISFVLMKMLVVCFTLDCLDLLQSYLAVGLPSK